MVATFQLLSRTLVNESKSGGFTETDFLFNLDYSVEEWPLEFSKHILNKIKEGSQQSDHMRIIIEHLDSKYRLCMPLQVVYDISIDNFHEKYERFYDIINNHAGLFIIKAISLSMPLTYSGEVL